MILSELIGMIFVISAERPKPKHMTRVTDSMITFINNRNYTTEIDKAGKPVLLLCMPKGPDFSNQSILLHQIAEKYKDTVKVCLLEEEMINGFRQMLHIKGTPVYLLFFRGKEKGRMLGMAGVEQLTAFLFRHLPSSDRDPGEEASWK
jgi:thioredoxin-like negative regulator of GroEL